MNTPRLDYIRVKWEIDESPDLSWLESRLSEDGKTLLSSMRYTQEELNEHPIKVKRWIKEDMRRLETCGDSWVMMGCTAEAEVSYPINESGDRRIETFTSGGLWGIESDSDSRYKRDTANDELEGLKKHLEVFNIRTPRQRYVIGDYWKDVKEEAVNRMDNTEHRRDSPRSQWVKVEDN